MPYKNKVLILLSFLLVITSSFAQDKFRLYQDEESYTLSFKLINNLIVLPIEVNGNELNFLVDTGVGNSIMFNLSVEDSLKLKNTEKVRLRGLGEGGYIDALRSSNNYFKIGKVVNGNHMIYLIPGKEFELSSYMGININGIIGGDLFRDFIVDINYSNKRIKFYKPDSYTYKACKKCETFDLEFYKDKPYINIAVQSKNDEQIAVKLLIDTGGGDAIWLFDRSSEQISVPERNFDDYLGKGLSGNIYGKRGKINKIIIGEYIFYDGNVAYPNLSSIEMAYQYTDRNGSLASEILRRFRIVIDYPHKKITFVKRSKYYKDPFLYNMSGIELAYSGGMLVAERQNSMSQNITATSESTTIEFVYKYVYAFKQSYEIVQIRKDSPAYKAGLLIGDVVLQINGKAAYDFKLGEIFHIFSTKPGKRINLLLDRNGEVLKYSFRLENIL
jgi:hypothetical protein